MNDKHLQDKFNRWLEMERSLSVNERLAFEGRLKQILDQEAAVNEAKWRMEAAEKVGREKGMEKGMKQGKEELSIQILQKMLERNMDVETVAEITGISIERTLELKAELGL